MGVDKYFISYSKSDKKFVEQLTTDLKDVGISVWLDDNDIAPGSVWQTRIHEALKDASGLIVILSSNSVKSDYVIAESSFAIKQNKKVIPLLIEKCEIPFRLDSLQYIDFSISYTSALKRLIKTLNSNQFISVISNTNKDISEQTLVEDSLNENVQVAQKEIEFKYASLANTQLKFIPTERSEVILKKLKVLCSLLSIDIGDYSQLEIIDEYYDDKNYSLKNNGCSFRRRVLGNTDYLVTLKAKKKDNSRKEVQERFEDEFKCSDDEFSQLKNTSDWICKRIKKNFGIHIQCSSLEKKVVVTNRRTSVPIKTNIAQYIFCYDKYYFYDVDKGNYSEYYAEIEIELAGQSLSEDEQLSKLRVAINDVLGYAPNANTKFDRGINSGNKKREVYVISMDIIGYINRQINTQKQIIQKLNHYTKEAIREIQGSGAEHNVVYLPTGDGMILIFEDSPQDLLPIIFKLQNDIKEYNSSCRNNNSIKFEFRTGIHYGKIFKYSDVNENLNFAGNGINLARKVMNLGDKWHIIATGEVYKSITTSNSECDSYFTYVGRHAIKPDLNIEVYNVHNSFENCGNPTNPIL